MSTKKEKKEKKLQGVSTEVAHSAMDNADIEADSNRYFNRELSWLEFNNRILFESRDTKNPLLERLKFLSITASNMDEFYIVRVASLRDLLSVKYGIQAIVVTGDYTHPLVPWAPIPKIRISTPTLS